MMYLIMRICESKLLSEIVHILGTSKCNKFSTYLTSTTKHSLMRTLKYAEIPFGIPLMYLCRGESYSNNVSNNAVNAIEEISKELMKGTELKLIFATNCMRSTTVSCTSAAMAVVEEFDIIWYTN